MLFFSSEQRTELWYTLKNNKRRSIVTSFGVFAGMFFFTVLISLGTGISNSSQRIMDGVSSELVFFMPGRTTIPYEGYKANRQIVTIYKDFLRLRETKHVLKDVACFTTFSKGRNPWEGVPVVIAGESKTQFVAAVSDNYSTKISTNIVVHGRDLRAEEIQQGLPLCVIGEKAADDYFKDTSEAVGQYLTVLGIPYRILGVVKNFSDAFNVGFNADYSVQVPLSYAVNGDHNKNVFIVANPNAGVTEAEAKEEVFNVIRESQHIHPDDKDVVTSMTMGNIIQLFEMIGKGINILIWIVGMGTLTTGVISVSNILLVTVRERQREIGVRRAIGAKPADIRQQFMAESIAIIFVAGSLGIFLGLLVALGLGTIAESTPLQDYILRPYPSVGILIFSVVIMLLAGVLAGLLPVYKALQIKAIDAIRDE